MGNKLNIGSMTNGRFHPSNNGKVRKQQRVVKAKTANQEAYMNAIKQCDVIFCLGPAGTGKTHIAAGMAAKLFKDPDLGYKNIIGVRPTVEAGGVEKTLGFLPGDLDAKIHPYLKPLLKELEKFLGEEELRKYRQGEMPVVDLSPLQYMRGTTFEDSIVILDEAQNATDPELWMFLTRIGQGSKLIINGDNTKDAYNRLVQCDLPEQDQGALDYYSQQFADFSEVGVITMEECDQVRHPLITKMMRRVREER